MEIRTNLSNEMSPFEQLTVVELASVLAGPSTGLFFVELGAKVIKIENKNTKGDVTRQWKLANEDKDHPYSAYYSSVNADKKSLFLDLKDSADFLKLKTILAKADIVIANFKAGDAEKLKLDFDSIKILNPHIIYGEITGFGKVNRTAYDVVLQAESGFLSMNGTSDGTLCKMPVALIDILAAHHLKEGLLIALLKQQKEKKAVKVSVSLYQTAIASLANQATNWLMGKHIAQPMGTLHPNIAPYGELFTCKDGKQIVLAIGTNKQFHQLCIVLGDHSISEDERFITNQLRVKNRQILAELIGDLIRKYERSEILNLLLEQHVPVGAVRNIKEVFEIPSAQPFIKRSLKEDKEMISVKGNAFTISE